MDWPIKRQTKSSLANRIQLGFQLTIAIAVTLWLGVLSEAGDLPYHVNLAGEWLFRLDPNDVGEEERWSASRLPTQQSISLPGTTDLAGKGFGLDMGSMRYPVDVPYANWPSGKESNRVDERGILVRDWHYIGKAWYQRRIDVPADWAGRHVTLQLERVLWNSHLWLDGEKIGTCDSLVAAHKYDLGVIAPGAHLLTICIDNSRIHKIGLAGHAYGAETQSRWNGVVGQMTMVANAPVYLTGIQAFPAGDRKTVRVRISANNTLTESARMDLRCRVQTNDGTEEVGILRTAIVVKPGHQVIERVVDITQPVKTWDEFNTTRYRLTTSIEGGGNISARDIVFGFRHIERDGRTVRVNGRPIFLRGTLDCCVYPKTGHPPVTVDAWMRVLETIKGYGFNHVRFHTWCPPDAAFEAADQIGIYLAPETPFWVDDWIAESDDGAIPLGREARATEYVRREIRRISDAYGNHPSFAFFCIGNEFGNRGTKWQVVEQMLSDAKQYDGRRLYNASTARKRVESDDFWVTHNSGKRTRGIGPPNTNWDFEDAVLATDLPVIAHETGQRPVFPDYNKLLPKFTGPLKPYNLVKLRNQLEARGMANQAGEFERASAQFQLLQYKAEHEGILRTPDFAGYQLLMFNDFTGQSEALVGIVDPFWETKGIIRADQVRQWNAPTVALARFEKFVWTSSETFQAVVEVSHFGPRDLVNVVAEWSLVGSDGKTTGEGLLDPKTASTGGHSRLGRIKVPLSRLTSAMAVTLTVRIGDVSNQWQHWVYPPAKRQPDTGNLLIVNHFDSTVEKALANGRRVLLLAHGMTSDFARETGFSSVYWSAGWWGDRFSSLGVLCNPDHPALAAFPNNGHSDWQWHALTQGATTFDLTDVTPDQYRPIVQPVTDFHHNRLLGHVFEARVGDGRLLVCGYDLNTALEERHAARQFRHSLLRYMQSEDFNPRDEWSVSLCKTLFKQSTVKQLGAKILDSDSEADGYKTSLMIDGNATTFWHTPWQGEVPPLPHYAVIDLQQPVSISSISLRQRQDMANGRILGIHVFVSDAPDQWGKPAAEAMLSNDTVLQTIGFHQPQKGRYLRIEVVSTHDGKPWCALSEIDVELDTFPRE